MDTRPCPKAPLVMKQLLPPIFLFHLVQTFRFFSAPGNFLTVRDPLMVKFFKIFSNVVFIAQIKRFGTLNPTQKIAVLYKALFLKTLRKTARNWPFLTKNAF